MTHQSALAIEGQSSDRIAPASSSEPNDRRFRLGAVDSLALINRPLPQTADTRMGLRFAQ
jgi:hypothetical protein